jgi:hypothetical protein
MSRLTIVTLLVVAVCLAGSSDAMPGFETGNTLADACATAQNEPNLTSCLGFIARQPIDAAAIGTIYGIPLDFACFGDPNDVFLGGL